MKKKMIAGALSLAMLSAMAIPVYAEENTVKTGTTPIEASIPSVYTLTIPSETDIQFNAASTDLKGVLKVTGNVLPTQSVKVSVETKALENSVQKTTLPYTLKYNGSVFTSDEWDETELRAGLAGEGEGKELTLSVAIESADWASAKAGTYEGSIVFTAAMQEKE